MRSKPAFLRFERLEDRVTPSNVGYYDMSLGSGGSYETAPITAAGQTPVDITALTGTQLSGLTALFVTNPSTSGYSSSYIAGLSAIQTAVSNGMVLIIRE